MAEDWRALVAAHRYGAVDWLALPRADQRAFLAQLRAVVPMDGGRYLTPRELAEGPLRSAALILQLDELAAAVEGDTPPPRKAWRQSAKEIKRALAPLADDHVSTGVDLPPAAHVAKVHAALTALESYDRFYSEGITDKHLKARIREAIALAAFAGFAAGQEAQLALRAPFLRANAGDLAPLIKSETDRQKTERQLEAQRRTLETTDALLREQSTKNLHFVKGRALGRQNNSARANSWHSRALFYRQALLSDLKPGEHFKQEAMALAVSDKLKKDASITGSNKIPGRKAVEAFFRKHDKLPTIPEVHKES